MSDVKPWEPVTYKWLYVEHTKITTPIEWTWLETGKNETVEAGDVMECTLANGQRIIVRALSDERKAARAAMREAAR